MKAAAGHATASEDSNCRDQKSATHEHEKNETWDGIVRERASRQPLGGDPLGASKAIEPAAKGVQSAERE
jgi:hypothetical protein